MNVDQDSPVGFVARRKDDGTIVRDFALPGEQHMLRDAFEWIPVFVRAHSASHIANEWADMASNGIQWLRNIRDGVSTPAEALEEMESNLRRIQALSCGQPSKVQS